MLYDIQDRRCFLSSGVSPEAHRQHYSQVDDEISNCSDSHQCLDGASLRLLHMTTLSSLPNNS